ncbi:divalent cation tolerance protein CutA [Kribbella catacumbae]|uniref:divalent cation tolerance protein CutA n=1 Tax=Kribbella catacumbae TaxID=460086 RepID=UPI000361A6C4|nr:divalent cation tolerance protein CutA [Kribbella catacumbae]
MSTTWQVYTAVDTRDDAVRLARLAVQDGLAASGQILGPATTMMWRQGSYVEIEEWRLTFITIENRLDGLHDLLLDKHTRDQPQVTGVRVDSIAADYETSIHRAIDLDSHGE